jgi:pilus assembly protein Flp/PilA
MKALMKFWSDESGATMVEYAVLVALIALAVIATVALVGAQIDTMFQRVLACIRDPNSAACTGAAAP